MVLVAKTVPTMRRAWQNESMIKPYLLDANNPRWGKKIRHNRIYSSSWEILEKKGSQFFVLIRTVSQSHD